MCDQDSTLAVAGTRPWIHLVPEITTSLSLASHGPWLYRGQPSVLPHSSSHLDICSCRARPHLTFIPDQGSGSRAQELSAAPCCTWTHGASSSSMASYIM
jgi:hypothetical protein